MLFDRGGPGKENGPGVWNPGAVFSTASGLAVAPRPRSAVRLEVRLRAHRVGLHAFLAGVPVLSLIHISEPTRPC